MENDKEWENQVDQRAADIAEAEMLASINPEIAARLGDLKKAHIHIWEIKQMNLAFEHVESGKKCEIIRNKLWIGDFESAKNLPSSKITAVISLGMRYCGYPSLENIKYYRISIDDCNSANIKKYFEVTTDFIDNHKGGVLVHCQAGVSRSATICIAYLMKSMGLSFYSAYMAVKAVRLVIAPNAGFIKQLLDYEKEIN